MIVKKMTAGIIMTHEQYALKYKTMNQSYKACFDNNNGSGNG